MKKYLIMLFIPCLISGCGIFKNVTKHREVNKRDSIETVEVTASKLDKSKIVITEKLDTAIKVKGYDQVGEWKLNPNEGNKFPGFITPSIALDSSLTNVSLTYDSLTHSVKILIKAKDQLVNAIINKRTEINNDIKEQAKTNKEVKVKTESKVIEKTSKPNYWFIVWVFAIGCVAYFVIPKAVIKIRSILKI